MTDVIGKAVVIISGKLDPASLNKESGKLGSILRKTAVIGVASFGAIAAAGVKSVLVAEESASVQNKLNRVLKNMGKSGAVKAVNDLADAESRKTGVDDDLIRKGQTILATFDSVAKSAGVVGGTFEQATKLSVDLAAAGFGSVDGAAKQLGKALSDPVKGISLLNRVGIKFTATQQQQIKNFVKAGDSAKAQGVILDAVQKKVGGLGEAGAKSSDKLKNAFGELEQSAGDLLTSLFATPGKKDGAEQLADSVNNLADSIDKFKDSKGLANFKDLMNDLSNSSFMEAQSQNVRKQTDDLEHLLGLLSGNEKFTAKDVPIFGAIFERGRSDGKKFDEFAKNLGVSLGNTYEDIKEKSRDLGNDFSTRFESIKKDIGKKVRGWKDAAVSALEGLPGKMEHAGSQAIQGFIKGLGNLGSSVGKSAGRVAQEFKNAINRALPNSLTFFGGKGGIPAITVPLPQLATGARNFGGGLAIVGEQGPELVNLPRGSDVFTNRESRNMSGITQNNTYIFTAPESFTRARQGADWSAKWGSRFGASTQAVTA